eukprot:UN02965
MLPVPLVCPLILYFHPGIPSIFFDFLIIHSLAILLLDLLVLVLLLLKYFII